MKDTVYHTMPENPQMVLDRIDAASATVTGLMLDNLQQNVRRLAEACIAQNGHNFQHL
jgi:hypothetical protein